MEHDLATVDGRCPCWSLPLVLGNAGADGSWELFVGDESAACRRPAARPAVLTFHQHCDGLPLLPRSLFGDDLSGSDELPDLRRVLGCGAHDAHNDRGVRLAAVAMSRREG